MKHAAFTYTNAKGETKERSVLLVNEPSHYVTGYDADSLSEEEIRAFAHSHNLIIADMQAKVQELLEEFELENTYKQFKPSNIQNYVVEYLE